jgi:hypothetical protein
MNPNMKIGKIYTIEWLRSEAEAIASGWNGKDDKFVVGGFVYSAEQADVAIDMLKKLDEVEALIEGIEPIDSVD